MKIQYCSDLHLEFPENKNFLKRFPIEPIGEILILAGDITPFAVMSWHEDFLDFVSGNFEKVLWIPGNHEYYKSDMSSSPEPEKIRSNVFLVNNQTVVYKERHFICSTLWSLIREENHFPIQKNISDFHLIKKDGQLLIPEQFTQMHQTSLDYIRDAISKNTVEKSIIVTHHVPTLMNYPAKYKGSPINEAFAVELHDFIKRSHVPYWIYGHHHYNIRDFKIGNTTLLTNQLGYVHLGEHRGFRPDAFFTL